MGNFHRTVPATMLSAVAVAGALQGSIVASQYAGSSVGRSPVADDMRSITLGHPAGLSRATTILGKDGMPASVAYVRTARRLFQGEVLVRDVEL